MLIPTNPNPYTYKTTIGIAFYIQLLKMIVKRFHLVTVSSISSHRNISTMKFQPQTVATDLRSCTVLNSKLHVMRIKCYFYKGKNTEKLLFSIVMTCHKGPTSCQVY